MERRQKGQIKWKNISGTMSLNGKVYTAGQTFFAFEEEVPEGFRDTVVPLEELPSEAFTIPVATDIYEIRSTGYGWYDVVNKETGKKMNDKGLREADAKKFVEELS